MLFTTLAALGALGIVAIIATLYIREMNRLGAKEREIMSREALLEATRSLSTEKVALTEAQINQSYEKGILEGLKQAGQDPKSLEERSYQLGLERGLLEGEIKAEGNFRIEYWTEIKKNQGYFFTSAEVVACYQLLYKNIPLGLPQRHTIEQSEVVDRAALNEMVDKVLGQSSLGPVAGQLQNIRVVSRDESAAGKELPSATRALKAK